jgi:mono/diheme cytochrome c family protein
MIRPLSRSVALVLVLAACDDRQAFHEPNPTLARMLSQRRADPYAVSSFFTDGKVMREPPPGTLPRDAVLDPPPMTRDLLVQGRERFEALCAACHGVTGTGESAVASKMDLRRPPSLADARSRCLSREELFARISDGYGMMPSYAAMLDVHERWAVVGYVRALQLSRGVKMADLPAPVRAGLIRDMASDAGMVIP